MNKSVIFCVIKKRKCYVFLSRIVSLYLAKATVRIGGFTIRLETHNLLFDTVIFNSEAKQSAQADRHRPPK